jgi:hypothetical protein
VSEEGWHVLKTKVQRSAVQLWQEVPETGRSAVATIPSKVEAKLALIADNRQKNYEAACKLRDHALSILDKLGKGELQFEKVFNSKAGGVVRAVIGPSSGDWVNIATYLRTIADLTYRALGDMAEKGPDGTGTSAGPNAPGAPAITIILPGAIAAPRAEREIKEAQAGKVIDLSAVVVEGVQNPPPKPDGQNV